MISIIDYGMGNLNSVQKALETAIFNQKIKNKKVVITNDKKMLNDSSAIILPGVGAFGEAIKNLEKLDLVDFLKLLILRDKKIFLGICLGFQLLFEKSYELGEHKGLGIIKGFIKKFDETKVKVPHIGWNNVNFEDSSLFYGIENNSYFYFVHSFFANLNENEKCKQFKTKYGDTDFLAGISYGENIFGVQFHPEKSQKNGIKLLENFVNVCKN